VGAPLSVKQLYDRYRRGDNAKTIRQLLSAEDNSKLENEERWILQYCKPINIKFVGVWDTVAALPTNIPLKALTGGDHEFLDANLRISEQNAYHALAIDENRKLFDATLFTIYADKTKPFKQPRDIAHAEQRWFCGSHGDVGGGSYNDVAAQIPLQWIMSKAKFHGLTFRQDVLSGPEAATAALDDSFADVDWEDILQRVKQLNVRHWRGIDRAPVPRPTTNIHTINETIDKSVFGRFRADPNYRPKNLVKWAQKHGQDLTTITWSVRADDPRVAVPD
jgi:hypothetical protein